MNGLTLAFAIVTLLVGLLLIALRLTVVDILRIRKLSHKLDDPKPLNLADNLAWALRYVDTEAISDRERAICRAYSIVWGLAIVLLIVTVALAFTVAN